VTRPNDSGGGGMTGATGDLTPDDADEPFVPAELREISDPERQAGVTAAHGRGAPAQHGDVGDPGAESHGSGSAPRDDGYGSGHGLSPADPAYRMERRRSELAEQRHHRHEEGEQRRAEGESDEFADHEDHF
jgi:hypothetical protein